MSYEVKYTTTLSLSNSIHRYLLKELKTCPQKYVYENIHGSLDLLEVGEKELSEVI